MSINTIHRIVYILVLFPLIAFAQDSADKKEQARTQITGAIANDVAGDVELIIDKHYIGDNYEVDKITVVDGTFTHAFSQDKPVWTKLRYNKQSIELYLEPGDELKLEFDAKQLDSSLKLSGKGSGNNKFWQAFSEQEFKKLSAAELKDKMKTDGIDAWEIFLFDQKRSFKKWFDANQTEYNITYKFEKYLKQAWDYYYLSNLMAYPIERANVSAKKLVQRIPEVMLDVLKEDKISNTNAMIDPNYRSFVEYLIRYKAVEENEFNKFEDRTQWLRLQQRVAEKYLEGEPLQYVLADRLWENGEEAKKSAARNMFRMMRLVNPESGYAEIVEDKIGDWMNAEEEVGEKQSKEEILAEIEKDREKLKENDGKFRLADIEGNKVAIEDFIGKVIYLDIWASWCGPCIGQMPAAAALKAKFTPEEMEQIVFLYISIDDHESRWKGAIDKHKIKGKHLHSPGGWNSAVTKKFGIRSIPHFMLFNKNGELVNEKAKRPSDETLYDDIMALVGEVGPALPTKKDNKEKEESNPQTGFEKVKDVTDKAEKKLFKKNEKARKKKEKLDRKKQKKE